VAHSPDASLDSTVLDRISDAVLEVVIPKPAHDSLTYEKPLPLDLLPYSVRTDKYYSIGTAFAIGPEEFVSAAHVLKLGSESWSRDIYLRDKQGHIYPIDHILKYSLNRDFVVFSLRGAKAKQFLTVNATPVINRKVYAVGNAHGQGIVIRDGLYTSDTPEEEAGRWKWIRFSAAASPGNSGGPLLDGHGQVIGIVLRKSPSENLNYAIPIAEVKNAKKHVAVFNMGRVVYRLDNMDMTVRGALDKDIELPKTYSDLKEAFQKIIAAFFQDLRDKLLAENRGDIFPQGPGSTRLMFNIANTAFPLVIAKGPDGNWGAGMPKDRKTADLGDNGSIAYGTYGKTTVMLLRKPDTMPLEVLYQDSRSLMDLILKSGLLVRYVGPEKIKITSLGKAASEEPISDDFGRIWVIHTWLSEYNDTKVVTFTLPVPDGCVVVMRRAQADMAEIIDIPELKILVNFIYMSYQAAFKDWRAFLTMKDRLPLFFSAMHIEPGQNDVFRFQSPRLSFTYDSDVMKISETSHLLLGPGFIEDRGKTILDICRITVSEDRFDQTAYTLQRITKPPKELPDQYHSTWEKVKARKFPYNRSVYFKDKVTIIETTHEKLQTSPKSSDGSSAADVIYTIGFTKPGSVDQKDMDAKLDAFLKTLTIDEGLRP
jgi:hypothetical protein